MRWRYIPGDPAAPAPGVSDDEHQDRIVVDELEGDLGISYLSDIAVWYADNNVRHGYDIRIEGSCFKGPYAIRWGRLEIAFEECADIQRLREHLASLWGPEGARIDEPVDTAPRLERIE